MNVTLADLKARFATGAQPTGKDFTDLIDTLSNYGGSFGLAVIQNGSVIAPVASTLGNQNPSSDTNNPAYVLVSVLSGPLVGQQGWVPLYPV